MAQDEPAYRLDGEGLADDAGEQRAHRRPWLGIHFECCGIYDRLYRNRDGTMYRGRCPRCLRTVQVRVGPEGTGSRLFRAQ